jgi:ribonucleotide monophosphatase NagD (HAD superfamily)
MGAGKPALEFYQTTVKQLDLPACDILMIGDGIETDIAGAQQAGLKAALVRTGKFRENDLEGFGKPWTQFQNAPSGSILAKSDSYFPNSKLIC